MATDMQSGVSGQIASLMAASPGPVNASADANIRLQTVRLVTPDGQRAETPVAGQMMFFSVAWATGGLASTDGYVVRVEVDGVAVDTRFDGTSGNNVARQTIVGGWYAKIGTQSITVTIDALREITETSEDDNSLTFTYTTPTRTDIPQKLDTPIGGNQFQDWWIANYADVDPRTGRAADYRGGVFQFDGNSGWDMAVANFGAMDRGVAVFQAAADGVVVAKADGLFDRYTTAIERPGNEVTIDHGNGWFTIYRCAAADTITVKVGDVVTRGQTLGFVGSSGFSNTPHLHFLVVRNGAPVETALALDGYWQTPNQWTYQGDQPTALLDGGITNAYVPADAGERIASRTVFSRTSDSTAEMIFWYQPSHFRDGVSVEVRWIDPSGATVSRSTRQQSGVQRGGTFSFSAGSAWKQSPGVWRAELVVDNRVVGSRTVTVIDEASPAELRVRDVAAGEAIVLEDRTTAIDVGTSRVFRLENYGGSTLTISSIDVPAGFAVSEVPGSLAVGGTATFTVRRTATAPGRYLGDVVVRSNEGGDGAYGFRIVSVVEGVPGATVPRITLPGVAVVVNGARPPVILDKGATLTDSDAPATANGYILEAKIASGVQTGDALGFVPPGLTVSGNSLLRDGTTIGTLTFSAGNSILVIRFNANSTLADVQTSLRGVGIRSTLSTPLGGQRVVQFSVVDVTGQRSPYQYRTADFGGVALANRGPIDLTLSRSFVEINRPAGTQVGILRGVDPDGDSLTYTLVSGAGSGDNSSFRIVGDQLQTAVVFDSVLLPTRSIRVRATDPGGLSFERAFTITLSEANAAPTDIALSSNTIRFGNAVGANIGVFSTTDPNPGDSFVYTLVAGAGSGDNGDFRIEGDRLQANVVFQNSARNERNIRVRSTDAGGLAFEKTFTILLTDGKTPPFDILLSNNIIGENNAVDATVGSLTALDADDGESFTYALVAGEGDSDNADFEIVGDQLRAKTVFNFEARPERTIRVRATDSGGLSYQKRFTIQIADRNDNPTDLTLSSARVFEGAVVGTAIGSFVTTDEDVGDTFSYNFVGGAGSTDNASFRIVGDELRGNVVFDAAVKSTYFIRVQTNDRGGGSVQKAFVITVIPSQVSVVKDGDKLTVELTAASDTVNISVSAGMLIVQSVSPSTITRTASLTGITEITVNAGPGSDLINLNSLAGFAGRMLIACGDGNDSVNVLSPGGATTPQIVVNGQGGIDAIAVDRRNTGSGPRAWDNRWNVTSAGGGTVVSNFGATIAPEVTFSGAERLIGGLGSDYFDVAADGSATAFVGTRTVEAEEVGKLNTLRIARATGVIFTVTGNNYVTTSVVAPGTSWNASGNGIQSLIGSAGADQFIVSAGATIGSIDAGAGENRVTLRGRVRGDVITGAGADTFALSTGASIGGKIDTGAGNDVMTINAAAIVTGGVFLGDGDDTYIATGAGAVSTFVDGGGNNDRLIGGSGVDRFRGGTGDDILVGNAGNDILEGGDGRDILIGGAGADNLNAGRGEDILIAGATTIDANLAALAALMATWTGAGDYATRIRNVTITTSNDSAVDTLNGDGGLAPASLDLYYGRFGQATDNDVFVGFLAGETRRPG